MSNAPPVSAQVMEARLQAAFKNLRLPGAAKQYHALARQATEQIQSYGDFLLALLDA